MRCVAVTFITTHSTFVHVMDRSITYLSSVTHPQKEERVRDMHPLAQPQFPSYHNAMG